MRSRLTLLIAVLALLAVPVAAQAKVTVGIAENNPGMFDDPLFSQLGAKHARLVVSWNVATATNDEINRVIRLPRSSRRLRGVTPLVTFEHARGDATICNKRKNRKKSQCKLPTAKQYEAAMRAFRATFPAVQRRRRRGTRSTTSRSRPTSNPKAAAKFTSIARKVFKGGTVVAADILDQADNVRAKRPTFRSTTALHQGVPQGLQGPALDLRRPQLLGHQPLPQTGTKAIIKALGCKQIWLTEAGGLYKFVRPTRRAREPPAEGDEVHVQGRQGQQEDQAPVRVHVVRRRAQRALRLRPGRPDRQAAQGLRRGAQERQVSRWSSLTRSGSSRRRAPT